MKYYGPHKSRTMRNRGEPKYVADIILNIVDCVPSWSGRCFLNIAFTFHGTLQISRPSF